LNARESEKKVKIFRNMPIRVLWKTKISPRITQIPANGYESL